LAYRTQNMFEQFLASAGYSRPQLSALPYGSGRQEPSGFGTSVASKMSNTTSSRRSRCERPRN
jgi:hypothetical protein